MEIPHRAPRLGHRPALVLTLASAACCFGWAVVAGGGGEDGEFLVPGARAVLTGRVEVNRVPASYTVYDGVASADACVARARRAGWRPVGREAGALPTAEGRVTARTFARGDERLLRAWTARGAERLSVSRFAG